MVAVTCVESGDEALKYLGLVDDLNQNSTASSSSTSPHSSQVQEVRDYNDYITRVFT